jgi:hypothetical protein
MLRETRIYISAFSVTLSAAKKIYEKIALAIHGGAGTILKSR